jgi:hypothetical protein
MCRSHVPCMLMKCDVHCWRRAVVLQVGLAWLDRWASGIAGKDQAPALCMSIASQLYAAQSTGLGPDEVAGALLDLLGDAAFEAVRQLLERRYGPSTPCSQIWRPARVEPSTTARGMSHLGCCRRVCVRAVGVYCILTCCRLCVAGRTCLRLCGWRWPSWQGPTSRAALTRGAAPCPATLQVRCTWGGSSNNMRLDFAFCDETAGWQQLYYMLLTWSVASWNPAYAAGVTACVLPCLLRSCAGVTVTSSSQKLMAKLERKQQRRGQAGPGRAAPGAGAGHAA